VTTTGTASDSTAGISKCKHNPSGNKKEKEAKQLSRHLEVPVGAPTPKLKYHT